MRQYLQNVHTVSPNAAHRLLEPSNRSRMAWMTVGRLQSCEGSSGTTNGIFASLSWESFCSLVWRICCFAAGCSLRLYTVSTSANRCARHCWSVDGSGKGMQLMLACKRVVTTQTSFTFSWTFYQHIFKTCHRTDRQVHTLWPGRSHVPFGMDSKVCCRQRIGWSCRPFVCAMTISLLQ